MRDITLFELQRLQPAVAEADDTLQMDQETFCALYERTARPLWVYLWRKTGDSQLADDLLQETYYRFLRARVAYDSETHKKNYLFRIATNLAHDSRRTRHELQPLSDEAENVPSHADRDGAERHQKRSDLDRAMNQLKPRHREALWLAYAEGSSHEEIAAILGLKTKSVKLILFRARRKLAGLLRGEI